MPIRHSPLAASQSGVTLIISIVLLAAITFISFVLSVIVIREIGATRTTLRSEPAIAAASAGGEIGMYRFLREKKNEISPTGTTPRSGATYTIETDLYDNPYPFLIQSTTTPIINIALFDADDIDNKNAGYESLTFKNNGPQSLKIKISPVR